MNKNPLKKIEIFNLLKKIKKIKLGKEKVSLENSLGRFLAEDIKSKINLPPFTIYHHLLFNPFTIIPLLLFFGH